RMRQAIVGSPHRPDEGSHSSQFGGPSRASGTIRHRLIVGFPGKAPGSFLFIEEHVEQNDPSSHILATQPVEVRKTIRHDDFGIDSLRRSRMITSESSENNLLRTSRALSR